MTREVQMRVSDTAKSESLMQGGTKACETGDCYGYIDYVPS